MLSVTVSIAADTTGTFSPILREKRDVIETSRGRVSEKEGGGDSAQNPVVIEADFFCKVEGSGVENWGFQATVEDPQGNNTLESFQPEAGAFLNASGSQQDFIAIVCNPEGLCTAASTADTLGVGCSQADQYKIRFSIADEDGNKSEEQTLDARFEGESTDTGQ